MPKSKTRSYILLLSFLIFTMILSLKVTSVQCTGPNIKFKEVAQLSTGGDTFQTEIHDDIAFVIDMDASLKTYDVTNPSRPQLLDEFDDGGVPHHFVIKDELLYLADHADGLEIYDISDPSNIEEIGQIADSGDGETDGVFVADSIAYTAEWHDSTWSWKMVLINVTDPTSPQRISEYTDGDDEFIRFYVQDEICYVACLDSGFKILNVSDPYSITQISSFNEGGYTWTFQIEEDRAYVSNGSFTILDITDINNLSKIENYNAANTIFSFHIEEDLVYLGVHEYGLEILNISIETNPTSVDYFELENIVHITKSGDYLYFSLHGDGLLILKCDFNGTIDSYSVFLLFGSAMVPIVVLVTYNSRRKKRRKN